MQDTNDTKIKVIDAICGAGKTSWAIQEMNKNKDKKYIYITPFLKEIDRIMASTDMDFKQPQNNGNGKLDSFETLISYGCNLVATHALFKTFDVEKKGKLKEMGYTLILDEVMEVIEKVNKIKPGDIKFLLSEEIIKVDDERYVHWIKDYNDTQYDKIKLMAESRSLVLVNNRLMVWSFPIDIFDCFEEVYILTYKFDGQVMKHYYDYHNVKYKKYGIMKENEMYKKTDYSIQSESFYINKYKNLINVYQWERNGKEKDLNKVGDSKNAFSVTWLQHASPKTKKIIRDNTYNYFMNKLKSRSYDIMWTTFKDYITPLSKKGYKECTLKDEFDEPLKDSKGNNIKQSCFVACNARATNDYKFKKNLAYLCNRYTHPDIKNFFKLKGVEFNEEEYALSELIQWLFRSQVRDGKPINIYIPSNRMRKLLIDWLNSAKITSTNDKVA